jgi:hypothetical protein
MLFGDTTINSNLYISGTTTINNLYADVIEYRLLQTTSDERFKTNIKNTKLGLEFINKLKPVDYKFNQYNHHGFIAQDVKKIINEMDIDFGGCIDMAPLNGDKYLALGLLEFLGPVVKAIQELSTKLTQTINELKYLQQTKI